MHQNVNVLVIVLVVLIAKQNIITSVYVLLLYYNSLFSMLSCYFESCQRCCHVTLGFLFRPTLWMMRFFDFLNFFCVLLVVASYTSARKLFFFAVLRVPHRCRSRNRHASLVKKHTICKKQFQ